jgi:hypothetical protein
MSPIKQRLLAAIEQTPEPLLDQTLAFLGFLTARSPSSIDPDFDPDTDSNAQILADLKASPVVFRLSGAICPLDPEDS